MRAVYLVVEMAVHWAAGTVVNWVGLWAGRRAAHWVVEMVASLVVQ